MTMTPQVLAGADQGMAFFAGKLDELVAVAADMRTVYNDPTMATASLSASLVKGGFTPQAAVMLAVAALRLAETQSSAP